MEHYTLHDTDGETVVQRGLVIYPLSHSWWVAEQDSNLDLYHPKVRDANH